MSRQMTAPVNAKTLKGFGYDGDRVTRYETITVTTYASGTRRASHGRLDPSSNRMVFTALSVPSEDWNCLYPAAHDLVEAANEHFADMHLQDPLF